MLEPKDKNFLRRATENDLLNLHFSLALFLRNRYLLGPEARLPALIEKGGAICDADFVGNFLLHLYRRHLQGKPIDVPSIRHLLKKGVFIPYSEALSDESLKDILGR